MRKTVWDTVDKVFGVCVMAGIVVATGLVLLFCLYAGCLLVAAIGAVK